MLKGTAVSPGVALGEAFVITCGYRAAAPRRSIQAAEVDGERRRLGRALDRAESELAALQREILKKIGRTQADVFGAQALLVRDPSLRDQVLRAVEEKRINVEAALSDFIDDQTQALDAVMDGYIRERSADVRDVGRRVLSALIDEQGADGLDIPQGAVVVAEELLPSVTARLELGRARAFVTERGSRFSHSSILARSLGTPAVAAIPEASTKIQTGDKLIVDALSGIVFVNPDRSIVREYDRLQAELGAYKEQLRHLVDVPSATLDGTAIPLLANVNKFADTEAALLYKAEGIGLYRTEFQFTIRGRLPTEDEQYEFLARTAERFKERKVVLRLLDLGGDKTLPYFPLPVSRNPSLAQRGIGLLLEHVDILKSQLKAFLRVSADHRVSILLPVVRGVEDIREARGVVRQVERELAAAGKRFNPKIPIGAMIEIPSAALMARSLVKEADFLSLGTNDLVQYVLAADREDESVAQIYHPLHPAVLQLVHSVAEASRSAGRDLTICGEMAGDPSLTELLLGLGLRQLSVAPGELLTVKNAIRSTRLGDAQDLARKALELGAVADIVALLSERRMANRRDGREKSNGANQPTVE